MVENTTDSERVYTRPEMRLAMADARRQAFAEAAEMCRKKAEEWLDESFSIHDAMREFALELEARAKGE